MRRWIVAILVAVLTGSLPLAVGLQTVRHVDPAEVSEESPLPSSFLLLYSGILGGVVDKNFSQAFEEKKMIDQYAYIPPNIKFIASRFNELFLKTTISLVLVQTHVNNATLLYESGRLRDARVELDGAWSDLLSANRTVSDLESSAIQLSGALRTLSTPLLEKTSGVRGLINRYAEEINDLRDVIEGIKLGTVLTIGVNATRVPLGSWIVANGSLTDEEGRPMSNRTVDVYFDREIRGSALTGPDGSYTFALQVPYIYKGWVFVNSLYIPRGGDMGYYSPNSSTPLAIVMEYDRPNLAVKAPVEVYPGLRFEVSGTLSLDGEGLSGHDVWIWLYGSNLTRTMTVNGSFSAEYLVPPSMLNGTTLLRVSTGPKGRVGPAGLDLTVLVVRVPLDLETEAPSIALAGLGMNIKGKVSTNGKPISNATINIRMNEWSSSTRSAEDGRFDTAVQIPLSASTAQYSYSISVYPQEPWIFTSAKVGVISVVNPVFLALPISVAGLVVLVLMRKFKRPSQRIKVVPSLEKATPIHKGVVKVAGLTGLYLRAVELVSRYTGIHMEVGHTIREYLGLVKARLGRVYEFFERLSLTVERFLYGSRISDEEESQAKRFAEELDRGLRSES